MAQTPMARCGHCGAEFMEAEMAEIMDLEALECGFCGHMGTIRYFPGREPIWNEPLKNREPEPLAREDAGSAPEIEDRPPPARGRGKTP